MMMVNNCHSHAVRLSSIHLPLSPGLPILAFISHCGEILQLQDKVGVGRSGYEAIYFTQNKSFVEPAWRKARFS